MHGYQGTLQDTGEPSTGARLSGLTARHRRTFDRCTIIRAHRKYRRTSSFDRCTVIRTHRKTQANLRPVHDYQGTPQDTGEPSTGVRLSGHTARHRRTFDRCTIIRAHRKTQAILRLYHLICTPQIKARDHAPFLLFNAEMRHSDIVNK